MENNLGKVGIIGRFKPLHNGAYAMLEAGCQQAEHIIIGIGSANKYNVRNPFTTQETEEMIEAALSPKFSNYSVIYIPDFAHIPEYKDGKRWKEYVIQKFGKLDYFITSNNYVKELLKDNCKIIHPADIIQREKHMPLRGSEVRYEIARYGNWTSLVPKAVADYLESNGLIKRFRKEFGLATIAQISNEQDYRKNESAIEEKMHAREV